MRLTKRALIRGALLLAAAAAVLGARDLQLMNENEKLRLSSEYSYQRAMGDLSDDIENVTNTLEKQLYASGADIHRDLSVKLCTQASNAKSALAQLPSENSDLITTNKFLSQVGDYSLSLSKKLAGGEALSSREYENIEALYDCSKSLCERIKVLRDSVLSGETVFESERSQSTPDVTDGFDDFEDTFENYPSLIYDGPFSDNILEKEPEMTKNAEKITLQQALAKCRLALNISANDLTEHEKVDGKMPGWRFSDPKNGVCCEVTESGGFISYFLRSRQPETQKLTNEEAVKCAEDFLADLGIDSLKTTYYESFANVLTVNFAYQDVGVLCYTDLIKVSVALDNGEILGYDAKGYLVNHRKRDYSSDLISKAAAKKQVSPKLTVDSVQLALIPSDDLSEKLCYEFRCSAGNGRNVLVYIGARSGKEEQILLLMESENGTLTI